MGLFTKQIKRFFGLGAALGDGLREPLAGLCRVRRHAVAVSIPLAHLKLCKNIARLRRPFIRLSAAENSRPQHD